MNIKTIEREKNIKKAKPKGVHFNPFTLFLARGKCRIDMEVY